MRIFVYEIDYEVGTEAFIALAFTGRSFRAAKAVRAVPISTGDEWLQ